MREARKTWPAVGPTLYIEMAASANSPTLDLPCRIAAAESLLDTPKAARPPEAQAELDRALERIAWELLRGEVTVGNITFHAEREGDRPPVVKRRLVTR